MLTLHSHNVDSPTLRNRTPPIASYNWPRFEKPFIILLHTANWHGRWCVLLVLLSVERTRISGYIYWILLVGFKTSTVSMPSSAAAAAASMLPYPGVQHPVIHIQFSNSEYGMDRTQSDCGHVSMRAMPVFPANWNKMDFSFGNDQTCSACVCVCALQWMLHIYLYSSLSLLSICHHTAATIDELELRILTTPSRNIN